MNTITKYAPWTIRILIALLFLISAVAKLYPSPYFAITTFEVKQLYTLGFSENIAPFFSRILIGIEFALGFLLLINHFLKRITIPATLLMLSVFTIHLTIITYFSGGNEGNCGCFGELIPMTPLEAIIKNVIAIGFLVLLLFLLKNKKDSKSNFWVLTTVTFASILGVFLITFTQPSTADNAMPVTDLPELNSINQKSDLIKIDAISDVASVPKSVSATTNVATDKTEKVKTETFKSGYAKYFADIDTDTKILCFFVPGCSHCVETATQLTAMKLQDKNFPSIQILFMDEEAEKIPEFFASAGSKYNYKIIDIISFWKVLGANRDVPGVKLLKNGKELKYFYGTTENAFNIGEMTKLLNQNK